MRIYSSRGWMALMVAALAAPSTMALSPPQPQGPTRRAWLTQAASVVATTTIVTTTTALLPNEAQAVASAGPCASGVGSGCADLAEGNALIQALQEKSAANKERNEKEARDAYYMKNYPDWFQAAGKTLIKKQSDGTFVAVDDAELESLKRDNRLTLETAKSMGGRVVDYTQKPILVLKE
eukprot:CAMPEP_0168776422 /NCGR_PEP_ID=MMETSP0725-20121227/6029_1 /TAXON_ID=265536 /ORGANISM="Amphiprora sp., Strain CCMP467" /LENGTH=179 /DNA_ID=CAMNT_0008826101 /DNA_START=81 /DNA_END=620 /DNA_ORIENTATION=-